MPENVIRRVTILADYKRGTTDTSAAGLAPGSTPQLDATAMDDLQQSISAVVLAIRAQKQATQEAAEVSEATTTEQLKGTRDVAEGVFRIVRATALLSGVQQESLQSLVRNLAMVQAAFDIYKGGSILLKGLQSMNPIMLGIATAIGLAALAWDKYNESIRKATEAEKEFKRARDEVDALVTPKLSLKDQEAEAFKNLRRARVGFKAADAAWREEGGNPFGLFGMERPDVAAPGQTEEQVAAANKARLEVIKAEERLLDVQQRMYDERQRQIDEEIRLLKENDPFKGFKFAPEDPEIAELKDEKQRLKKEADAAMAEAQTTLKAIRDVFLEVQRQLAENAGAAAENLNR